MAYEDPWAWTKEHEQNRPVPQMSNSIPQMGSGAAAQAPQVSQGPPGIGQMAQQIVVARGVNKGIDAGIDAATPSKLAPVVDSSAPVLTEQGAAEVAASNGAPPLSGAATGAATAGATDAAVVGTETAVAGTETAAVAGTETAAVEGAGLAAMGPVGWGIGALLLAKQMKWI